MTSYYSLRLSPSEHYSRYTRPATEEELARFKKNDLPTRFFADCKAKTVFVDNPILTDVTQEAQCDIRTILQGNPDLSGLGLILDDSALEAVRDSVSIEDFLPPSDHYDVFDLYDFIENSKKAFNRLPARLRKTYNNDPAQLAKAFESKDPGALAALYDYLQISPDSKSAGQAEPLPASGSKKDSETGSAPGSEISK